LLVGLILYALYNKYLAKHFKTPDNPGMKFTMDTSMKNMEVIVKGMTCNHCKANVENGLIKLDSVSSALADPDKNIVRIHAEKISEEIVKETVEGLGYIFKGPLK
jgi:copper chaperone CopZ